MSFLIRGISQSFSPQTFLLELNRSVFKNVFTPSRNYGYRIKHSLKDGNPVEKASVASRFFRLPNGLWIRRQPGYHAHLWKKNWDKIHQLRKHEVLGPEDSRMLDKMVSRKTWRKRYWVDHAMDHWTNHITMQAKPPWKP